MIKFSLQRSISLAYAGLLVTAAFTSVAAAEEAEAVIRLKANPTGVVHVRSSSSGEVARGQSPQPLIHPVNSESVESQNCPPPGAYDCEPEYCSRGWSCRGAFSSWMYGQRMSYRMRSHQQSHVFRSNLQADCREKAGWARCKFGYFIPSGNCGHGTPPLGFYSMVYPVNPEHFDGRDGQVYAAQGYAGPVAIPIAPNVNHTYNYGWGMPSSRLTPISHPVSPSQAQAYGQSQVQAMPVQP